MLSAINNQGKVFFMLQRMAVNSYHFIRFLHRLILDLGSDGRKLFVICDNARIHHSKLVKAWAKKHEAEIEIFHMPAYSPELNPDEFLNRSLKTELRSSARVRTRKTSIVPALLWKIAVGIPSVSAAAFRRTRCATLRPSPR